MTRSQITERSSPVKCQLDVLLAALSSASWSYFPLSRKVERVFFVGSPDLIVAGGNDVRQRLTAEMDEET